VELVGKLNHGPDPTCPGPARTRSPELEVAIALPNWAIGWDLLCGIGHRRCARHWAISRIPAELFDGSGIRPSADSLARYIRPYQILLAARPEDPATRLRQSESVAAIILSIDGLQAEKGPETLSVVREWTPKRVGFAAALIAATAAEVRRLIARAQAWAEALGQPVALGRSDRQDAFGTAIAAEFPDVPHRYGPTHFRRDVAQPVLEADSHAKVPMRPKGRGLRAIEPAVLKRPGAEASRDAAGGEARAPIAVPAGPAYPPPPEADPARAVVLDSCAAVRGILNDDPGGPLHPPGLRMAAALGAVRESIPRDWDEKRGGSRRSNSLAGPAGSTAAATKFGPIPGRSEATPRTSRW
jgi:hypothetical protein